MKSILFSSVTLTELPPGISSIVFEPFSSSLAILVWTSVVKYYSISSLKSAKLFSLKNFKLLYIYKLIVKSEKSYIIIDVLEFL